MNVILYISLNLIRLFIKLIIILVIIAGEPLEETQVKSVQDEYTKLYRSYQFR